MKERILTTHKSGILYEPSLLEKSGQAPGELLFERLHWIAMQTAVETPGGRGSVLFIRDANYRWVLRHYRRGGLMARFSKDRYLWLGADRTRSFHEWRLLARLQAAGLPAPAPVAARYVREGLSYTADLLTEELPHTRSLTEAITGRALAADGWRNVGATLARFHRSGVHHADLNAHNILLDDSGKVFVLDFDRGRLRAAGAWRSATLARLQRSLCKIRAQRADVRFSEQEWGVLMEGYRRGM